MGQFDIVAIGSSVGGIKAMETFLAHLPFDFPVPILFVQHPDPRRKSLMAEIMQRQGKQRVTEAVNEEAIRPSVVYITPPNKHMLASVGIISLTSTAFVHFIRPSIDLLSESAAATCGDRAIGVILGTGPDGAMGIKAIKEKGGLTIAQDERTPEHREMPRAAVVTGMVGLVLLMREIVPAIIALIREKARR